MQTSMSLYSSSRVISRPVSWHSPEILIEQDDKVKFFLEEVSPNLTSHTIPMRTTVLAASFVQDGTTVTNLHTYHQLYKEFLNITKVV